MLASMMLDKEVVGQILTMVTGEMLYQADHQIFFDVIGKLYEQNRPIDPLIIERAQLVLFKAELRRDSTSVSADSSSDSSASVRARSHGNIRGASPPASAQRGAPAAKIVSMKRSICPAASSTMERAIRSFASAWSITSGAS